MSKFVDYLKKAYAEGIETDDVIRETRMVSSPYIVTQDSILYAKSLEAEVERLQREAAIRIDQIEREQEAHLKTMADLNKQAEMNGRLLTENAELRAENVQLLLELDMQQATILVPSQKDDKRRIERLDAALKEALDEAAALRAENEKLRDENAEWKKMVDNFILMNDAYKEQIEFWMKEAKDQKYLHEKARELGVCEGRLDEIQKQKLIQADIKSSN